MNPVVSVIIPVYNVQDYIEQCLASVLNQTYRELEVIMMALLIIAGFWQKKLPIPMLGVF